MVNTLHFSYDALVVLLTFIILTSLCVIHLVVVMKMISFIECNDFEWIMYIQH